MNKSGNLKMCKDHFCIDNEECHHQVAVVAHCAAWKLRTHRFCKSEFPMQWSQKYRLLKPKMQTGNQICLCLWLEFLKE